MKLMLCWFRGSKINHFVDITNPDRVTLCGRPVVDKMRVINMVDDLEMCKSCVKINDKNNEVWSLIDENQKV